MAAEIIKCERVVSPPVRFIGKHYDGYPNWNDFWENNWFDEIEKAGERAALSDDSYCVLTGSVDGKPEFYLGEFFPEGTPVPNGFDFADIPPSESALFFIKGQQGECYEFVYQKRAELIAELERNGMTAPPSEGLRWSEFERDNCPRFTDPDEDGNLILDFGIFLTFK